MSIFILIEYDAGFSLAQGPRGRTTHWTLVPGGLSTIQKRRPARLGRHLREATTVALGAVVIRTPHSMNFDTPVCTLSVFSDAMGERGALSRGGVHGQRRAVFRRNGGGCVCLACRRHYPTGSALVAVTLATNA
jgi:hypothetical protein